MRLTYFNIRGRCDAIRYMLVDAGVAFQEESLTLDEWLDMKASPDPKNVPFSLLPTLTFGHGARGGSDTVLAESSAILHYLELTLSPPAILNVRARVILSAVLLLNLMMQSPPDARARLEMVRSASFHVWDRIISLSTNPDWLSTGNRKKMKDKIVLPYLVNLEYHLSVAFFPPLYSAPLTDGRTKSTLTPAAATAASTLSLIACVFPNTLNAEAMVKDFPKCAQLVEDIEKRPRIAAWLAEGGRPKEWSIGPNASLAFIEEHADTDE